MSTIDAGAACAARSLVGAAPPVEREEETPTAGAPSTPAPPDAVPAAAWLAAHPVALDTLTVAGVSAAVAAAADVGVGVATAGVAGWGAARLVRGRDTSTAGDRLAPLVVTLSAAACWVSLAAAPVEVLRQLLTCLVPATATVLVLGAVHQRLQPARRAIWLRRAGSAAGSPPGAGLPRGVDVLGVAELDPDSGRIGAVDPTLSGLSTLPIEQAVSSWRVDLLVVGPDSGLTGPQLRRVGWALESRGVAVAVLPATPPVARHRVRLDAWHGQPILRLTPSRPPASVRLAKWLLDRTVAGLLLFLVLPLLAGLALAVRCDSRGPAFFVQVRVGRDGRRFRMYKLRTMTQGAERLRPVLADANEADGVLFKIREDPRVTRVGRVLRRTSLDELPQLLNVVRGDMSLVGPRPALPQEVARYDGDTRRRLAVRPGLTGLWQISGRADLDWQRSVELDLHYTDNISFAGDLAICLRTMRAVLGGKGAY